MNFINSDKVSQKSNPYSKPKMHPSCTNGDTYLWLLKPTGLNRGRGIQIFNNIETLEKQLYELCEGVEEKFGESQPKKPEQLEEEGDTD